MSDPFSTAHQFRVDAAQKEENRLSAELISVLRYQAQSAERSGNRAWMLALGSLVVTAGSLATAIIALMK